MNGFPGSAWSRTGTVHPSTRMSKAISMLTIRMVPTWALLSPARCTPSFATSARSSGRGCERVACGSSNSSIDGSGKVYNQGCN